MSDKLISATSCQIVPFPPPEIGLLYQPDSQNNMKLTSGDIIGYLFILMMLDLSAVINKFFFQSFLYLTLKFHFLWQFHLVEYVTKNKY